MNYQQFIDHVVHHISSSVSNVKKVVVQPVIKNNGMKYDGLVILDPFLNISPTIYLNPYYHRYLNGVSMEDIYEDILKTYETYLPTEDFDISQFVDFEKAKKTIIYKLVNKEKNKELEKPTLSRTIVSDFTPEALMLSHYNTPRGIVILVDEIMGMSTLPTAIITVS